MNIERINPKKPELAIIMQAVEILKKGGVVAFPTDTAYGFAVDALSEEAIGKLFIMKKRIQKPLPVIVSSIKMLKEVAIPNEKELKIAKKYWPGPLTIIFKKKELVPPALTLGLDTIGVRIPDNKVALALINHFGKPLTSTSANITGQPNCYTAEDVERQFSEEYCQPELILDAGELPGIPVSTVIQIVDDKVQILRQGPIKIKI